MPSASEREYSKYASSSATTTCAGTASRKLSSSAFDSALPVGLLGVAYEDQPRAIRDRGQHRVEVVAEVLGQRNLDRDGMADLGDHGGTPRTNATRR